MQFLSDVYVPCEVCKGKRYNRETFEVKYKGKNIDEILNMTVEEALGSLKIYQEFIVSFKLLWMLDLGYVRLGQPSTTIIWWRGSKN